MQTFPAHGTRSDVSGHKIYRAKKIAFRVKVALAIFNLQPVRDEMVDMHITFTRCNEMEC